jgi:hypothetical protein
MMTAHTSRTASCACGGLSISVEGDPISVYACSCTMCQRRSGSVFAYMAMWPETAVVEYAGAFTTWRLTGDTGFWTEHDFCPVCGSRLVARMQDQKDNVGISVGNFADPDFPAPHAMVWSSMLHKWLALPPGVELIPSFTRD